MQQITELPLHSGKAPRWLFGRMVKLGGEIATVIIDEFGEDEFVRRVSDANWFQALACSIGYDWHSSGTTTVTVAALKEALNDSGVVYIAGGKGKAGLKTPEDIENGVDKLSIPQHAEEFKEYSRLVAKVDGAMVYDNIGIYEHAFIFSRNGKWSVIQQAMDPKEKKAIRFQWLSDRLDISDLANEPHTNIETEIRKESLDLTYSSNKWVRESLVVALEQHEHFLKYPYRHRIFPDADISERGIELIRNASEMDPKDYRQLLLIRGVGRSTVRSLAFIASLIYDKELSYRDPVAYSYNLGGKDAIPFKINKNTYDEVISSMKDLIDAAHIGSDEKYGALRRLNNLVASHKE